MSALPLGIGTDFTGEWHLQPDMCFGDDFTELVKSQGVNAILRALIIRGLPHVVHRITHKVVQGRPSLHIDLSSPIRNWSEDIFTDGIPFIMKPPIIGQLLCTASYTADGAIICKMEQEAGTAVNRRFLGYRTAERPSELVDADTPGAKLCLTIEINWTSKNGKKLQCSRVLLPKDFPVSQSNQQQGAQVQVAPGRSMTPASAAGIHNMLPAPPGSPSGEHCDLCDWTPDKPASLCSSDCEYEGADPQQCRCDQGPAGFRDYRSTRVANSRQPDANSAVIASAALANPPSQPSAASGNWITNTSEAVHVSEVSSDEDWQPARPPRSSRALTSARTSSSSSFVNQKRTKSLRSARFAQAMEMAGAKHPAPIFRVTDRAFIPMRRQWRGKKTSYSEGAFTEGEETEGDDADLSAQQNVESPSASKSKPSARQFTLHSPGPRDPSSTVSAAYDPDFGSVVSDTPTRVSRRSKFKVKVRGLLRRRPSSPGVSDEDD